MLCPYWMEFFHWEASNLQNTILIKFVTNTSCHLLLHDLQPSKSKWQLQQGLPIFMTWDCSICLGAGWLLGLRGILAVGLRIMPPWIGLFMVLVVAAQVTLTAEPGVPHSPDVIAGRGVLPPIIPVQKPKKVRHRYMTWKQLQIFPLADNLNIKKENTGICWVTWS